MTDLKREDVARVLAIEYRSNDVGSRHRAAAQDYRSAASMQTTAGTCRFIALELNIRSEFESALKALEKEQDRG